jgi:group I intron endonuclease
MITSQQFTDSAERLGIETACIKAVAEVESGGNGFLTTGEPVKSIYKTGGIYKISSIINPNKFYIGSTVSFGRRKSRHLRDLRHNKHGNSILQNHFNKYGEKDLCFEIVEIIKNPARLIEREQYHFDVMKPTFNVGKIVACPNLGRRLSDEQKLERSKRLKGINKGKRFSDQHRINLAIAKKGIKSSLGRVLSNDTKRKISQSLINLNQKGSKQTAEQINRRLGKKFRKVINVDTGKIYNTIKEAALAEGINQMTLCGWLIDTRRNKTSLKYYNQ